MHDMKFQHAAFFDVDGTIISTKSLVSFVQYLQQQDIQEIHQPTLGIFIQRIKQQLISNVARDALNREYFSIYKGMSEDFINRLAQCWFAAMEASDNFYVSHTIAQLKELQARGYKIVLVTGSFQPLLNGLMERWGVDESLCTLPEIINGVYTGELIGNPCIGEQKRKSVIQYALKHQLDLTKSYAFGDDVTDDYMLDIVGHGIRIDAAA
jgi:HAD superfamily hydrolase (TIGR01490 family)